MQTDWKIVDLTNVVPKSKAYIALTRECTRIDMHHLPNTFRQLGVDFARRLGQTGGPYMRSHSIHNRLRNYVNKPSRNGKYIEVLPEEVQEFHHLPRLMRQDDLALVEVGLNQRGEICKVAYTTTLASSGRTVFLCIGAGDGGLKTFYITPRFKYRNTYTYSDKTMITKGTQL